MEIPGYALLEKLGEGGMATVWRARQDSLDRDVAIKILQPELASDPEQVETFVQEAKAAASLRHANVIQVYDVGEIEGIYYFAMEYINGHTLGEILAEQGSLSVKDTLTVARSIAEALQYGWTHSGLVHRDIKPDNIMLDEDHVVKLADLGLAGRSKTDKESEYIEGTPNYMSPEQASGTSELDFRSDMYSLGATLYHALTGQLPFRGREPLDILRGHINDTLPNPRDLVPSVTPGAAQLVTRLMMKHPSHRYPDWGQALQHIKRVALGRPIIVATTKPQPSTIEPMKTAPGRKKKAPTILPVWIRWPAWGLLLAWFAAFTYMQTHPPLASDASEANLLKRYAMRLARMLGADEGADAPAFEEIQDFLDADLAGELGMKQLKVKTTGYLISQRFHTAKRLIREYRRTVSDEDQIAELDTLYTFVHRVSTLPAVLRATFRDTVGRETTLFIEDTFRTVRIRAVSGDRVSALITDGTRRKGGSTRVFFEIPDLDPDERARLLGPANTPVKSAMRYLLYMQAANYESAAACAEGAGPLSDAFKTHVESKVQ